MATRIFSGQVQNLQELEAVVNDHDGGNRLLKMLALVPQSGMFHNAALIGAKGTSRERDRLCLQLVFYFHE